MSLSNFKANVEQLAQESGIQGLVISEEGECQLVVDESIVVNLRLNVKEDILTMVAPIGQVNPEHKTTVYEAILAAQLDWNQTRQAKWALQPDSQQLYLIFQEPDGTMTSLHFQASLERVILLVELWKQQLEVWNQGQTLPPASSEHTEAQLSSLHVYA